MRSPTSSETKIALVLCALAALNCGLAKASETKGPVTDEIGVLAVPKGAPIQIGGYWIFSGADGALGTDQKRGVEVAIKDWKNTLVGHSIKLITEDSLCSAEGGQTAATKLAANPNLAIVLGPSCSSEATPGAPILWKAGLVDIGTSTTAPALTSPTRKADYAGFARTVYNDIDQGRADAQFLYEIMKARKVVAVHDGTAYPQQLVAEMAKGFKELGGTILSQEAVAPTDVDMHPVLTRIASEKPDAIYFPIFVAAGAQILRQARATPGLEKVALLGGAGHMAADMIEASRDAIIGFRIAYPDVSPESMGKGHTKFLDEYKSMFGEAPISGYNANAYDAATLAFKAIEKVAVTDKSGTTYIGRKALRDALLTIKFEGISGPISCDQYGQCAKFKPAVYEFINSDPKTFKIGVNPKKIWP
jgi:branched-chain amino acid transport system substrate-binding protein